MRLSYLAVTMPVYASQTDCPARRYGALNDMLSSVCLIEKNEGDKQTRLHQFGAFFPSPSHPIKETANFYAANSFSTPPSLPYLPHLNRENTASHGLFCDRWTANDILNILQETNALNAWKNLGFRQICLEIEPQIYPNRHALNLWTIDDDKAELLMQIVVWLEYIKIDNIDAILPAFCVEHLRLQAPNIIPQNHLLPGQDFASTGMLRRIFGIIRHWATCTGAALITEIPEYFHTAYIFSRYFSYIDNEMQRTFLAMIRSLLPTSPSHDDITRISYAFEAQKIQKNNTTYLWPTEMQAYIMNHELSAIMKRDLSPSDEHYTCI